MFDLFTGKGEWYPLPAIKTKYAYRLTCIMYPAIDLQVCLTVQYNLNNQFVISLNPIPIRSSTEISKSRLTLYLDFSLYPMTRVGKSVYEALCVCTQGTVSFFDFHQH
jgi:hypothetical protein